MADPIHELFGPVASNGSRIPGGCHTCDAYQTLTEVEPGVWTVTVHHDDDCATWRAVNAGAN
ncbi:MAG: hypothetical protein WB565_07255 [Acidimicrobiales bacterium]